MYLSCTPSSYKCITVSSVLGVFCYPRIKTIAELARLYLQCSIITILLPLLPPGHWTTPQDH